MNEETLHLEPDHTAGGPLVQLRVVSGPHTGACWTFNREANVTIGREAPSQLKLPDEKALSREHLELEIGRLLPNWLTAIRATELGSTAFAWLPQRSPTEIALALVIPRSRLK